MNIIDDILPQQLSKLKKLIENQNENESKSDPNHVHKVCFFSSN
jgi:hypothetical protein